MRIPFLSKPIDIYKQSYLLALEEFQGEGLNLKYDKSEIKNDFDKFLLELKELENNPKSEIGKVKESTYWLIDTNEFIGRISIRHTLTPYYEKYDGNIGFEIRPSKRNMGYGKIILELAMNKYKTMGMKEVIIMCKESNRASIKIIEKNQGILIEKYNLKIEGQAVGIRKYTIDLNAVK